MVTVVLDVVVVTQGQGLAVKVMMKAIKGLFLLFGIVNANRFLKSLECQDFAKSENTCSNWDDNDKG